MLYVAKFAKVCGIERKEHMVAASQERKQSVIPTLERSILQIERENSPRVGNEFTPW